MKKVLRTLLKALLFLFLFFNIITAFHAYKFTHFYDLSDLSIKKAGDKTGWDKTKEILFGINAVKQKNNINTDSTFQTVFLKSTTCPKLESWYLRVNNAIGTVCMFHGHGSTKSGIFKESESFRKIGYNTLLVDFRAHGNSEGNTCTIGYDESEDVKLAYDYIKSKGEKNIVLWGISMGAAAISKSVTDYQLWPSKIILEMPFGSIQEAAEGRIKMMGLPGEPLATMITFWGGIEHGFWAFSMKPSQFVKDIKCPVLLQWGRKDPRVSENETNEIYNNIGAIKKLVVYETCGHESLCKKENEKWTNEITAFLK
jgi:alpha-beta hydrolase superfamily lysophospholipase